MFVALGHICLQILYSQFSALTLSSYFIHKTTNNVCLDFLLKTGP